MVEESGDDVIDEGTVGPYRLIKPLDKGAFGEVWEAKTTPGNEIHAIKIIKLQNSRHSKQYILQDAKKEYGLAEQI